MALYSKSENTDFISDMTAVPEQNVMLVTRYGTVMVMVMVRW